jgi:hypothetical protein
MDAGAVAPDFFGDLDDGLLLVACLFLSSNFLTDLSVLLTAQLLN